MQARRGQWPGPDGAADSGPGSGHDDASRCTDDVGCHRAPACERWLSVFGCMVEALIAVLDIQITNSSLPQIEGGIGTGSDNGTWISTSYLIGEIIMIL